jgi:cytochrome c553
MPSDEMTRRAGIVEEFERHESRADGQRLVTSLDSGLSVLRDLFYGRMHFDVEQLVGTDSMLMPLSEPKTQRATKVQIEIFQVVESALLAEERRYISAGDWYLDWLARFRLGDMASKEKVAKEIQKYREMKPDGRRLALTDVLMRVLPESRKAPLVLFRLVPLAIRIATAVAFGDTATASELRQQQRTILPAVADCPSCHGIVLNNGDLCAVCSNPMWAYQWLTAAD